MKKTITLFAALIITYAAQAQAIKYHDVSPDTTISNWEVFGVLGADIWWHPSPEVVVNTMLGGSQILCDNDTMPLALSKDADISATSTGKWLKPAYQCLNCGGVIGNWKGVTDKYLAIRDSVAPGTWKYGWIRLSIPANATSFTIKDWAIHNTAGTPVKAGQAFGTGIAEYGEAKSIQLSLSGKAVTFRGISTKANVLVTDMSGRQVLAKTIAAGETLDLSSCIPGVYIMRVSEENSSTAFKIALHE